MRKLSRKGGKYEQNWSGPYEIAEKAGKGTFYLRRQGCSKVFKTLYNSTRLKPFHERQWSTTRCSEHTECHSQSPSACKASNLVLPRSQQSETELLNDTEPSNVPRAQQSETELFYDTPYPPLINTSIEVRLQADDLRDSSIAMNI